jgi:hypothetical protein
VLLSDPSLQAAAPATITASKRRDAIFRVFRMASSSGGYKDSFLTAGH